MVRKISKLRSSNSELLFMRHETTRSRSTYYAVFPPSTMVAIPSFAVALIKYCSKATFENLLDCLSGDRRTVHVAPTNSVPALDRPADRPAGAHWPCSADGLIPQPARLFPSRLFSFFASASTLARLYIRTAYCPFGRPQKYRSGRLNSN